jgi:hypothetical protein
MPYALKRLLCRLFGHRWKRAGLSIAGVLCSSTECSRCLAAPGDRPTGGRR